MREGRPHMNVDSYSSQSAAKNDFLCYAAVKQFSLNLQVSHSTCLLTVKELKNARDQTRVTSLEGSGRTGLHTHHEDIFRLQLEAHDGLVEFRGEDVLGGVDLLLLEVLDVVLLHLGVRVLGVLPGDGHRVAAHTRDTHVVHLRRNCKSKENVRL